MFRFSRMIPKLSTEPFQVRYNPREVVGEKDKFVANKFYHILWCNGHIIAFKNHIKNYFYRMITLI